MTLLLEIKDSKANFFMELLKIFPYVKTKTMDRKKQRILNDLKKSIEEVKLHKRGKLKLKTAKELLNEL